MSFYIATKFGFVSGFVKGENYEGEQVLKAQHCLDVRMAKSFKTSQGAHAAFKQTYNSAWWFCVLSTENRKQEELLRRAAEKLDGDDGDDELATDIYDLLGEYHDH